MFTGKERDDAIGLAQFLGAQDNCLIAIGGHGLTVAGVTYEVRD